MGEKKTTPVSRDVSGDISARNTNPFGWILIVYNETSSPLIPQA